LPQNVHYQTPTYRRCNVPEYRRLPLYCGRRLKYHKINHFTNYLSPDFKFVLHILAASVLASGTQVCRFKPGRSHRMFRAKKSSAHLPSEGKESRRSHVVKDPKSAWKSSFRENCRTIFSPILPPFATRFSCVV
jgi:hypothetical protein